jgi:hypothetical protein
MPPPKPKTKKAKKKKSQRQSTARAAKPAGANYRVRVRMYRDQGLGDCFLLTFPRKDRAPFNLLIDCGALQQNKGEMVKLVEHIEASVKTDAQRPA